MRCPARPLLFPAHAAMRQLVACASADDDEPRCHRRQRHRSRGDHPSCAGRLLLLLRLSSGEYRERPRLELMDGAKGADERLRDDDAHATFLVVARENSELIEAKQGADTANVRRNVCEPRRQ